MSMHTGLRYSNGLKSPIGFKYAKGVTLIELMVGLGLGLFIMLGVTHIYANSSAAMGMQKQIARVQEHGRLSAEHLSYELRNAGGGGCAMPQMKVANTVEYSDSGKPLTADFAFGLTGYEQGDDNHPSPDDTYAAKTDAFRISGMDVNGSLTVTDHNVNAATIHTNQNSGYPVGTLMAIVSDDCTQMAIFVQTHKTGVNVNHGTGTTNAPFKNCTKDIVGKATYWQAGDGAYYDCSVGPSTTFGGQAPASPFVGGSVAEFTSYSYYIRESATLAGVPALYRASAAGVEQEIVIGVEDMQLTYGWVPNAGVSAVQFSDASLIPTDSWPNVYSVKLELLVRATESSGTVPDYELQYNGQTLKFTDGILRKSVSQVVHIRNRIKSR
ncbi:MAG: hypothetical protein CMF25_07305 [Kangiellaceae bacterium]|nr:hypothetical protein [Kangiellaceae bacterium]|tara:strand:+ start:3405 stop:4553 length:1149 start_codon:yes stop_codon:yes gene_type:complete